MPWLLLVLWNRKFEAFFLYFSTFMITILSLTKSRSREKISIRQTFLFLFLFCCFKDLIMMIILLQDFFFIHLISILCLLYIRNWVQDLISKPKKEMNKFYLTTSPPKTRLIRFARKDLSFIMVIELLWSMDIVVVFFGLELISTLFIFLLYSTAFNPINPRHLKRFRLTHFYTHKFIFHNFFIEKNVEFEMEKKDHQTKDMFDTIFCVFWCFCFYSGVCVCVWMMIMVIIFNAHTHTHTQKL